MHDLTDGDPDLPSGRYQHRYVYRADSSGYPVNVGAGANGWCPSIHMPKEAARIFLRVTDVRAERLQDITEKNIRAEGCVDQCCMCSFNKALGAHGIDCGKGIEKAVECTLHMAFPDNGFLWLWDSTIKKTDILRYGWKANPWVWAIEFEKIEKPEGWTNV